MNPSDALGPARSTAGTPSEQGAAHNAHIVRSQSRQHIDAGSSSRTAAITGTSGTLSLAVRTAPSLSQADPARHAAAVSRANKRCYQFVQLPVEPNPREIAETTSDIQVLERHLDGGRTVQAVQLFGAIAPLLCAAEFQGEGRCLLARVCAHIDEAPPRDASLAWHGAAQLHEAAGVAKPALAAYSRELALLDGMQTEPGTAQAVRNRIQQLHMQANAALDAVEQQLENGDEKDADAQLMTALPRLLSRDHEARCLRLASDIALMEKDNDKASLYFRACKSHKSETSSASAKGQAAFDGLLLESAFRHKDNDEIEPAIRMYDDVIPRLEQRNDNKKLAEAIALRLDASKSAKDNQWSPLNLKLARAYLATGRPAAATYCFDAVLREADALDSLGPHFDLAADLLTTAKIPGAAQWCRDAASRPREAKDIDRLFTYVSQVLKELPADAAVSAVNGDFGLMLDYVEALLDEGKANKIPGFFSEVVSMMRQANVDTQPAELALGKHFENVATADNALCVAAQIRLNTVDEQIKLGDFGAAAESLREVLDMDLSEQPALERDCLYGAANLAIATGKTHEAVYLAEAAELFEEYTEGAELTPQEKSAMLPDGWDQQLDPQEADAARKQARAEALPKNAGPNFDPMFDVAIDVADEILEEDPERSATPRPQST